jgi:hypothetical protein
MRSTTAIGIRIGPNKSSCFTISNTPLSAVICDREALLSQGVKRVRLSMTPSVNSVAVCTYSSSPILRTDIHNSISNTTNIRNHHQTQQQDIPTVSTMLLVTLLGPFLLLLSLVKATPLSPNPSYVLARAVESSLGKPPRLQCSMDHVFRVLRVCKGDPGRRNVLLGPLDCDRLCHCED